MDNVELATLSADLLDRYVDQLWQAWHYAKATSNPKRVVELEQDITDAEHEAAARRQATA